MRNIAQTGHASANIVSNIASTTIASMCFASLVALSLTAGCVLQQIGVDLGRVDLNVANH